ncbi:phospholipase D-like domain-containing protein [Kocuria carniphila]|uniref:phospholipase D-like domain-containing protein n=1 Tax=Kocuria carniphila TaxID=262208 RepID=UPI0034CD9287
MELLNQPLSGQLGDRLIELLDSTDYQTLNIIVAFAKNSGVLRIKDALEKFRRRGGTVNVCVGVDLGGTSHEALTSLLLHTDSLQVVHAEKGQTFHPKIYYFQGDEKSLVIVGSHNLTGGGLWTNFENSVIIPVCRSREDEVELQKGVDDYIGALTSLKKLSMPIGTQPDIDKLLENGYIFKEVAEQVRRANSITQEGGRSRLFGSGVPAKLPRVATSNDEPERSTQPTPLSVPHGDEGQTIWFETRRMTGGARNILDLSKKSLIESGDPTGTTFALETTEFMRGGVEFFGLNPIAIEETKDITINFEGVDYTNNTILFPKGKKANGSWRLQIKGVTLSGDKITEAFRTKSKEYYLVKKVIAFTKVQDDYYFMSVFPDSELENFRAASHIVARNGSTTTAKLLGLL